MKLWILHTIFVLAHCDGDGIQQLHDELKEFHQDESQLAHNKLNDVGRLFRLGMNNVRERVHSKYTAKPEISDADKLDISLAPKAAISMEISKGQPGHKSVIVAKKEAILLPKKKLGKLLYLVPRLGVLDHDVIHGIGSSMLSLPRAFAEAHEVLYDEAWRPFVEKMELHTTEMPPQRVVFKKRAAPPEMKTVHVKPPFSVAAPPKARQIDFSNLRGSNEPSVMTIGDDQLQVQVVVMPQGSPERIMVVPLPESGEYENSIWTENMPSMNTTTTARPPVRLNGPPELWFGTSTTEKPEERVAKFGYHPKWLSSTFQTAVPL